MWQQFYQVWNSGSNTSAVIRIVNQNTALDGNDFGLDDISFKQMCYATDSVTVTVSVPVAPSISSNSPVCIGDTLKLFVQTVPGSTYQWTGPNGFSSTLQNPVIPNTNGSEAGTYSATTTTSYGCVSQVSTTNVSFNPSPTVDLGNVTSFCHGSELVLNAGNFAQYYWSTGSQNASVTIQTPGTYSVTVTDNNNCKATGSINISYFPVPQIQITANPLSGCEPLTVSFNETSAPSSSTYLWSFSDTTTSSIRNPVHIFQHDGLFDVNIHITDVNGCSTDTLLHSYITVFPIPDVNFTVNPSTGIPGANATFSSSYTSQPATWTWNFGDAQSESDNIPVTHHNYSQTGNYTVVHTVTTDHNCSRSATQNYLVINLEIPNSFTPNGDSYNDIFFIEGLELLPNCKLQVFNRWGKKIYESYNYKNDWDGSGCPEGVYYYVLTYPNDILKPSSGSITILR